MLSTGLITHKLATIKSLKADVLSISPASEQLMLYSPTDAAP